MFKTAKANPISVLGICVLALALGSCGGEFSSMESRKNTIVYLHDSSEVTGEFLGMLADSIYIDHNSSHIALPISAVESMRFQNDASPVANGLVGFAAGTLIGALGGWALVGHQEGFGLLLGGVIGAPLGAIAGLAVGINSGSDRIIWMENDAASEDLQEFARYNNQDLRRMLER